jgi:hypothetical protein
MLPLNLGGGVDEGGKNKRRIYLFKFYSILPLNLSRGIDEENGKGENFFTDTLQHLTDLFKYTASFCLAYTLCYLSFGLDIICDK